MPGATMRILQVRVERSAPGRVQRDVVFFTVAFFAVAFFVGAFFAVAFFAVAFFAVAFFAVVFLAVDFLATTFLVAAFFVAAFLAAVFFAAVFFAAGLLDAAFFAAAERRAVFEAAEVCSDFAKASGAGAPSLSGFLIFSPLPCAMRLRFAWIFAYRPFFAAAIGRLPGQGTKGRASARLAA